MDTCREQAVYGIPDGKRQAYHPMNTILWGMGLDSRRSRMSPLACAVGDSRPG